MRTSITFLVVLVVALPADARIINVPADYPTIQAGIDASVNGDTVLVAPGEYVENPVIQDKNILLTSAEGPGNTRINGQVRIYGASVDSTCILRGFRIDGYGLHGWPDHLVYSRQGAPIIWGNIIENYVSYYRGGGVFLEDSPATIRGNIIRNNRAAAYGGGTDATDLDTMVWDRAIIEGNIVSGNVVGLLPDMGDYGGIGGGVAGIIRYNLVINNTASRMIYHALGGGIGAGAWRARIYNNTIVGNSAWGDGGHGYGGGWPPVQTGPLATAS